LIQALKSDGWDTDPFTLTIADNGQLIGRGSSDDKGPILGWLNVLEAHKDLKIELPVNLRFVFEGMEESGSLGLDQFIASEHARGKDGWFHGVDAVCIVRFCDPDNRKSLTMLSLSPITTGSIPVLHVSPMVSGV
jgi:Cys-Gly metallodipeptidase DUG1